MSGIRCRIEHFVSAETGLQNGFREASIISELHQENTFLVLQDLRRRQALGGRRIGPYLEQPKTMGPLEWLVHTAACAAHVWTSACTPCLLAGNMKVEKDATYKNQDCSSLRLQFTTFAFWILIRTIVVPEFLTESSDIKSRSIYSGFVFLLAAEYRIPCRVVWSFNTTPAVCWGYARQIGSLWLKSC
jgi:hypothetical protein